MCGGRESTEGQGSTARHNPRRAARAASGDGTHALLSLRSPAARGGLRRASGASSKRKGVGLRRMVCDVGVFGEPRLELGRVGEDG
ncbi:hypothetical protein Ssi02_72310 [Sinosporangium siamense]|uniref:Uncharacterized protein n=1 Tax=Sinosporangium siamense TaxID=1367973 RepID=A0A919RNF6_9ACTN|nr:hypothetical protein Ssi02_72310 [Sinosporangium siamense]